jgi:hypothetical protein
MLSVWLRGAMKPRATRARSVKARPRLESLNDATAHLHFAARAWYEGAGRPAMSAMAANASGAAVWTARKARRRLQPAAERAGQAIDIRVFLSAQSIGWYGPMSVADMESRGREIDDQESHRPDSLAS